MPIDKIADHAERIKSRYPSQFDDAVNLNLLIDIIGGRTQELETQLFKILDERHLTVAAGVQLDGIGQILDLDREFGETDLSYRTRLASRTGELSKSGELENVISVFKIFVGASSVWAAEFFPAGIQMNAFVAVDPTDTASIIETMNAVKAQGVKLILTYSPSGDFFELSDESEADINNDGPIDALHGLGDEVLTEGGGLSAYII